MAKKPPKRTHDTLLQVWVTAQQRRIVQAAAKQDGRTLSNWVRDRLAKAAQTELGRIHP